MLGWSFTVVYYHCCVLSLQNFCFSGSVVWYYLSLILVVAIAVTDRLSAAINCYWFVYKKLWVKRIEEGDMYIRIDGKKGCACYRMCRPTGLCPGCVILRHFKGTVGKKVSVNVFNILSPINMCKLMRPSESCSATQTAQCQGNIHYNFICSPLLSTHSRSRNPVLAKCLRQGWLSPLAFFVKPL